MSSFSTEISIDATVDSVWAVLADFGTIDRWNPGIVGSQLTTDRAAGVEAARRCDLGGRSYLKEEVVEWETGKRLTLRVATPMLYGQDDTERERALASAAPEGLPWIEDSLAVVRTALADMVGPAG